MAKSEHFKFDGGAASYIFTALFGWIITFCDGIECSRGQGLRMIEE